MTQSTAELIRPGLQADGRSVLRAIPFFDLEIGTRVKRVDGGDGRTIEGIAVPYNREIDLDGWAYESWQGNASSGPFDHQLTRTQTGRVKVANRHILLGGDLIGNLKTMANDAKGLRIAGRVTPGVRAGDEAMALLEDGALDELSIGFWYVPGGDQVTRDADGRPHIRMIKANIFEVALEPFGAYGRSATVDTLRSQQPQVAPAPQQPERDRVVIFMGGQEVASVPLLGARQAAPAPAPTPAPAPAPVVDEFPALPALPSV